MRISHYLGLGVFLVSLAVGSAAIFAVGAAEETITTEPSLRIAYTEPPSVSATAVMIVDAETGTVVYEKQADEVLPIASVTKLLTAAAVLELPVLDEAVVVTGLDTETLGRSGRLVPGDAYTRRELLFPLLLESSNDAAALLARTSPTALPQAMEAVATAAGAVTARFADTSGLSDGNVATARDLVRILTYLADTHPHLIDITTLRRYVAKDNAWQNNSPVFSEVGYAGGKHGYTEAAGRTLVAQFDEVLGSGERRFYYVVLGSADLAADISVLRRFTVSAVRFE